MEVAAEEEGLISQGNNRNHQQYDNSQHQSMWGRYIGVDTIGRGGRRESTADIGIDRSKDPMGRNRNSNNR